MFCRDDKGRSQVKLTVEQLLESFKGEARADVSGAEVDHANYRFTASDGQSAKIAVVRQDDTLLRVSQPEDSEIIDARHSGLMQLRDIAANFPKQAGDLRMNVFVSEERECAELQCGNSTFTTISFFRNRAA